MDDILNEEFMYKLKNYINTKTNKNYFKNIRFTSDNIQITCPFHKDGQETKPSANIRRTSGEKVSIGTFHCFTCGCTYSLSDMVKQILQTLYNPVEIETLFGLSTLIIKQNYIDETKTIKFELPKTTSVSEDILREYRFYHPYLTSRGITEDTANIYDIGYDKYNDHITFPIRDINHNCLAIGRRSIQQKRYEYPQGFKKPLYGVYELNTLVNYLYIVEGPFNLWSLKQWGKEGVALLGTGTEYQYKQLLQIKCNGYVLTLDPDPAGYKGIKRLGDFLLNNNRKNIYVTILPDGKDVNDLTQEQFNYLSVIPFDKWNSVYTKSLTDN